MSKIDTCKLSVAISDTLRHRDAVVRSGRYLAQFLIAQNRSLDAIRLIGRCSVHDISKLQNSDEFVALASIVEKMDEMKNVSNKLGEKQVNSIKLHWAQNSHHPEHYESPNDMSDLDLLEMACDCHARSKQYGTSLIEYIDNQQSIRFHFDNEHYYKLRLYSMILMEITKDDDYSDIFIKKFDLQFDLFDSTLGMLVDFNEEDYPGYIKTDRLYFCKTKNSDFSSVVYQIYSFQHNKEIGNIAIKCNGEVDYVIYHEFSNNGYEQEILKKILTVVRNDNLLMIVNRENNRLIDVINSVGFEKESDRNDMLVYSLKKRNS